MLHLEVLDKSQHDRNAFYCDNAHLTQYLKENAKQDVINGVTQVYVLVNKQDPLPKKILGYFTLNAFLITTNELPPSSKKSKIKYPTSPAILIGRLAKDFNQKEVSGSEILYAALCKAKSISKELGAAYAVVHAIDQRAAHFYVNNGFEKIPSTHSTFVLPLSSIK
ncbi:MAG: hypothetical protein AB7I18_12330 [Candidatus Berkiella sp.]